MKIASLKSTLFIAVLAAGLTLTSCKDKSPEEETGIDTVPESMEPMEPSYDDESDDVMTTTDSITETNRDDKRIDIDKQVP